MTTGTVDLANSIYIDWGTFINAVINFLIIAFVVFSMVKLINKFKELTDFTENMKKIVQKKLDADEELTSVEKEWLEKYSKNIRILLLKSGTRGGRSSGSGGTSETYDGRIAYRNRNDFENQITVIRKGRVFWPCLFLTEAAL